MHKIRHRSVTFLLALCGVALSPQDLLASQRQQEHPSIAISEDEARDFSRAFATLVQQGKVTLVVEGTPFQTKLETLPTPMPQDGSVRELVLWLAKSYDYTAEAQGDVWILRKKYTDPADVPAVTLAECRQTLDTANRLMTRFHPSQKVYVKAKHVYHGDYQLDRKFLLSLSSEQLSRMHGAYQGDGIVYPVPTNKALPVAALSVEQKQWLWQIALGWYMQDAQNSVTSTIDEIDNLNHGAAFVYYKPRKDANWGYETRNTFSNALPNSTFFWRIAPKSFPMTTYLRNKRLPPPFRVSVLPAPSTAANPPVFTLPTWMAQAKPLLRMPDAPVVWADDASPVSTIGSTVAQMNLRADAKGTHFTVDGGLASKPMTVFGADNASPEVLMRAIGRVYDLRVVHLPEQPMRITYRLMPDCRSLADLSRVTWNVLPAPLRRAFHIEHADPEAERKRYEDNEKLFRDMYDEAKPKLPPDKMPSLFTMIRIRRGERVENEAVGAAMGTILTNTVKPRADAQPDEPLPVSDLRPREEAALATYLMAMTFRDAGNFVQPECPRYVTDFDSFYVCGAMGIGQRPEAYSFTLAAPRADGKEVAGSSPIKGGTLEPEYPGAL